jgi:hypothetical protein
MTTSSPTAALPGTTSSTSRGASDPSEGATGRKGSDQCALVLLVPAPRHDRLGHSFAVELALYHAARMDPDTVDVDFELSWMTGHARNYNVQEAQASLAAALAEAGTPD